MNSRDRFFAHLAGDPVDHLPCMPITIMLAATHLGVKFGDYAKDHRILAEAQTKIARDLGFDQVSVISDPGREAADCGANVRYFDDQPPALDEIDSLLADKGRLKNLKMPDPLGGGRMTDRVDAIRLFKKEVGSEKIIEGWVEGPIAEAADLRGINRIMVDLYEDPGFVQDLFDFVLDMEIAFAKAQIEAGADSIGIGDAAASLVGPKFYQKFILPGEKRLVDAIHEAGALVRLHICGRTNHHFAGMASLGCDIVDLDWMADMGMARQSMGPDQILLGNIDPVAVLRNGNPIDVINGLNQCYQAAGPRYIVGAGCEVPRDTPWPNLVALREFCATVHN